MSKTITLTSFALSVPPSGNQQVLVSWRRKSDPDIPANWTNAPTATIDITGAIISPAPYQIIVPETSIVIKAVNVCGGVGWQETFVICEPITNFQGNVLGQCAAGYTLSPDGTYCFFTQTQPAIITSLSYCVLAVSLKVWGDAGTRIYNPGHNVALDWDTPAGQYTAMTNIPQWKAFGALDPNPDGTGPINRASVWIDADCNGVADPLSAGTKVTLATTYNNTGPARTVYVGCAGDNVFMLKVNNVTVVDGSTVSTAPFKLWHIVPVQINNGTNYFNIVGTGDGSTGDCIAMVIYDNTKPEIIAATDDSQLNILFNSKTLSGQPLDVATCAADYNLDTSGGSGSYICRRITITNPT